MLEYVSSDVIVLVLCGSEEDFRNFEMLLPREGPIDARIKYMGRWSTHFIRYPDIIDILILPSFLIRHSVEAQKEMLESSQSNLRPLHREITWLLDKDTHIAYAVAYFFNQWSAGYADKATLETMIAHYLYTSMTTKKYVAPAFFNINVTLSTTGFEITEFSYTELVIVLECKGDKIKIKFTHKIEEYNKLPEIRYAENVKAFVAVSGIWPDSHELHKCLTLRDTFKKYK